MEISFLGSIGHVIAGTGLKDINSVTYAENTVPHMLSGKVFADFSRYILYQLT